MITDKNSILIELNTIFIKINAISNFALNTSTNIVWDYFSVSITNNCSPYHKDMSIFKEEKNIRLLKTFFLSDSHLLKKPSRDLLKRFIKEIYQGFSKDLLK